MEQKRDKDAWVAGLTETMPLTALDYTAPQNYMMKSFIFPFESTLESDRQKVVAYLKGRLARTFSLIPALGGQMIHARDGELPRLVYSQKDRDSNLDHFPDEVCNYQVLGSTQYPWSFDDLSTLGAPPLTMTKDLLWLLPETGPAPGDACHPITLRISFIADGLILGFAFHHGILDGGSVPEFLALFTTNTLPNLPILQARKQAFIKLTHRAAQTTTTTPNSGYDFTTPTTPPILPPAIAKIFTLADARVRTLHVAALSHLRATHGSDAFASASDVVCALAWLHVTRARLRAGRVTPFDTTHFATAVSVRGKLGGVVGVVAGDDGERDGGGDGDLFGEGYLGNMWVRALAGSTVGGLVMDVDMRGPVTVKQVAEAAWCVRRAVMELVKPEVLRGHLALAARATDLDGVVAAEEGERVAWPEVDAAVRRRIARHHTGLDGSVGLGLGADVEFEIPGVNGGEKTKPTWVRRAYVANDGSMNLMPRKGVTKGNRDWEIWLALREEDMRAVEEQGELGGWLSRPAA